MSTFSFATANLDNPPAMPTAATFSSGSGVGGGVGGTATPLSVRAAAFDPTSPAALAVCPLPSSSSEPLPTTAADASPAEDQTATAPLQLDAFFSHDGVGCNAEETSCLQRLLDSRDDLSGGGQGEGENGDVGGEGTVVAVDPRSLSRRYRLALRDCLAGWEERLASSRGADGVDDADDTSIELLKLSYAIVHLSEVYLLPRRRGGGDGIADVTVLSLLPAGSLTADTVRYLRLHHLPPPDEGLADLESMLASSQPEHYEVDGGGEGTAAQHPYWTLLCRLVSRGCLEEAWAVLSRHGACRRCVAAYDGGDDGGGGASSPYYDDGTLAQDREAFGALRAIFLSAPLPGGRDDAYDDGLAGVEEGEGDGEEEEEEGREKKMETDDGDEDESDALIDGVPRSSYRLWEDDPSASPSTSPPTSSAARAIDLPSSYSPGAASASHRTWSRALREIARSDSVSALLRRVPRLRGVLSILSGDFGMGVGLSGGVGVGSAGTAASALTFDSWAEELTAELLYQRPDVRPGDVHVRARKAMERHGVRFGEGGLVGGFDEIVLSVMRGNAGRVVEALHELGGGSGAALPAAVTSLLCDLLADAGRIPTSFPFSIQTDLLLSASEAILSSFSIQSHSDVGVRMAVRLLLPHAAPDGDVRVSAMIAEVLGRHWPRSDAEARGLLALCELLIRKGNVPVADACEGIAMCRALHYARDSRPGGAAFWLLRGMECRASWPPKGRRRVRTSSHQRFASLCTRAANDLINALADPSSDDAVVHSLHVAQEISDAVEDDEAAPQVARDHAPVNLLRHVIDIAIAMAKGDDSVLARNIVNCVEERVDEDGAVATLAHPRMYEKFLSLALSALDREDAANEDDNDSERGQGPNFISESAFDVHGIHILMSRLTQILSWENMNDRFPFDLPRMRMALCKGLTRAFVSENSMLKKIGNGEDEQAYTIDREVELMLSPSVSNTWF